jgi:hypothetical protein
MANAITFLHTAAVHVAGFEQLLAEADPGIPARHIVDEQLLEDIRAAGMTVAVRARIAERVQEAAAGDTAVVVCTCSTIGGCAEAVPLDTPLIRVDRAMAEKAVALGSALLVVAALETTLPPTRALLLDAAERAGRVVTLREVLCPGAWPKFEAGDQAGYLRAIAEGVRTHAAGADVVVLAQASMAGAAALCADLGVPVLSSPRLGVAAAVQAYRARHRT